MLAILAITLTGAELRLDWNDNSDNEEGFVIERSQDGVDFLITDQVGINVQTYTDTNLLPSTEYWYRVRAFNSFGQSGSSNVDSAVTQADGAAPGAPGNLKLTMPGRMTNISSRGLVSVEAGIVIGGFVIVDGPVKVLVRAVGPTLAGYGIQDVLADPHLKLVIPDGTVILENDNWAGQEIIDATTAVGAFPLPTGSLDSAFVIQLPPGNYTTHVAGVGGLSGVALLEIYEVPPSNN